jgi:molybdate transport system permease protein
MSGVLLISIVGPTTFLGRAFGGRLTDSVVGIVLAQVFVAAPFVVVAARSAFSSIDPGILDSAASLGWGEWQRFRLVSLRLAGSGILAGLTLAWLRAFGEFGATVILAYHPYSLPVFTYVQFGSSGVSEAMAPSALALLAAVAVLGLLQLRPARAFRDARRHANPAASLVPAPSPGPVASPARPVPGSLATGSSHPEPSPISFDVDHQLGSFSLNLAYRSWTPHLAILGPSGAGKSVTLRALAGLFGPDAATVSLGARDLTGVPTERRNVGYVPQEPTLLPFQNVWQQVQSGRDADPAAAAYWIAQLKLSGLEYRMPDELSGGQRRRVALARALCRSPQLLLLDEPLSGLDAPVRDVLRRELRAMLNDTAIPSVIVTHDPEEAAMLAEEIVVVDNGRALQAGRRTEVFARPADPLVASLLGIENICVGTMEASNLIHTNGATIEVSRRGIECGSSVYWCISPDKVTVDLGPKPDGSGLHRGTVVDVVDLGREVEVLVAIGEGLQLWSRSGGRPNPRRGAPCAVRIPPESVVVWSASTANREAALG